MPSALPYFSHDQLLWEELHSIVSELSQSKAAAGDPALPALVVTGSAGEAALGGGFLLVG